MRKDESDFQADHSKSCWRSADPAVGPAPYTLAREAASSRSRKELEHGTASPTKEHSVSGQIYDLLFQTAILLYQPRKFTQLVWSWFHN